MISYRYDNRMRRPLTREYYGYSDFYNFGYWLPETRTQKEASENLMEKLLTFIPEKRGTVLDVACGMGATTRHLLKYYEPSKVIGINLSYTQLVTSRLNAPGCSFLRMDAARLGFNQNAFDNIICVEAVFDFDAREDFLKEAYRLLRPGGHLVLSDILFPKWAVRLNPLLPQRNWVTDLKEYRDIYLRIGFREVRVMDVTRETWTAFYNHSRRWCHEKLKAGEIGIALYLIIILRDFAANLGVKHYLLVSARKP